MIHDFIFNCFDFSYSYQGSPLNPKMFVSYLNAVCILRSPKKPFGTSEVQNKLITASFLRPLAVKDPVYLVKYCLRKTSLKVPTPSKKKKNTPKFVDFYASVSLASKTL